MTDDKTMRMGLLLAWIAGGVTILLARGLGIEPIQMLMLMIFGPIVIWWLAGVVSFIKDPKGTKQPHS